MTDFIAANPLLSPDSDERPIDVEFAITRLNSDLDTASQALSELEAEIGAAEQTAVQAQSDAGRQLAVVDEPVVPTQPESQVMDQLLSVVMFLLLGLLVAGAALGVVTYLDGSVRLPSQVRSLGVRGSVVAIPKLKALSQNKKSSSRKRASSKRSSNDKVA